MDITKWMKPIWKVYILYDFNYMTFRWRQNYDDIKTICGWQGSRWRERWISRAQRILRAVKLCHHSSKCSSSLILWSKPIGCTTLRANPSRNYRVCVIMMSQCRLLKGDKGTPVPDAHSGGADFLIRIWLFVVAPPRLLCPWDSSGKNTGMSCHFLLQGPFPTQGLNPRLLCLLHCRQILYPLRHLESRVKVYGDRGTWEFSTFCSSLL